MVETIRFLTNISMKLVGFLLLATIPIIGGAAFFAARKPSDSIQSFQTEPIKRGDIAKKITATGTIEPEELVDVGAQVMGLITGFGKDLQGNPIDYNSVVDEGTELAYIDKTPYSASQEQAEATLEGRPPAIRGETRTGRARLEARRKPASWQRHFPHRLRRGDCQL
jgi:HlyD family secretion protein